MSAENFATSVHMKTTLSFLFLASRALCACSASFSRCATPCRACLAEKKKSMQIPCDKHVSLDISVASETRSS
eukprot:25467_4